MVQNKNQVETKGAFQNHHYVTYFAKLDQVSLLATKL